MAAREFIGSLITHDDAEFDIEEAPLTYAARQHIWRREAAARMEAERRNGGPIFNAEPQHGQPQEAAVFLQPHHYIAVTDGKLKIGSVKAEEYNYGKEPGEIRCYRSEVRNPLREKPTRTIILD
jgi:hypothetical protein